MWPVIRHLRCSAWKGCGSPTLSGGWWHAHCLAGHRSRRRGCVPGLRDGLGPGACSMCPGRWPMPRSLNARPSVSAGSCPGCAPGDRRAPPRPARLAGRCGHWRVPVARGPLAHVFLRSIRGSEDLEQLSPAQFAKVMDTLGSSRHGQQILAAWIGKEKLRDALNLRARTCTRGGSRAPAQAKSRSPLGNRAAVRSGLTSGSRDTAAVAAVPPACDPAPGQAHAPAAGAL